MLNVVVKVWEKRDIIPDRKILFQKCPSIIKYIAGEKNGLDVVKVFLREDDKEAQQYFERQCSLPNALFEFVNTSKDLRKKQNTKETGRKENTDSSTEDVKKREMLRSIIQKHEDILIANYSNISGIGVGQFRSNDSGLDDLCIVLHCLDKLTVPFGERMLPKYIEGHQVDIREDFFMLGCSKDCKYLDSGCSIGRPSVNSSGSVGFFVKKSLPLSEEGFLTAAHVALGYELCSELFDTSNLFSKHCSENEQEKQIVHPSWEDSKRNNVAGKVAEAFFGNHKIEQKGIDAAYVVVPPKIIKGSFSFIFGCLLLLSIMNFNSSKRLEQNTAFLINYLTTVRNRLNIFMHFRKADITNCRESGYSTWKDNCYKNGKKHGEHNGNID